MNAPDYRVYPYPSRSDRALRDEIEDMRHRGARGGYIVKHRAMITSRRGRMKILSSLATSLVLLSFWLYALRWVSVIWANVLSFWNDVLGMGGYVALIHYQLGTIYTFKAPYLHVASSAPDYAMLLGGWIVSVILFIATYFMPRRYLPVTYIFRLIIVFQLVAQVFFTFVPLAFPYSAAGYIHGILIACMGLIALVPVMLGLTYSIFDYSWLRKVGLALLVMGYLTVLVPVQFAVHAFILYHMSLLFLPLLFFAFGLPVNIMIFIGLYSWGASWQSNLHSGDVKPEVSK